jgi:hypothetical protein
MTYLSKYQNIRELLVLDADNSPEMLPLFYLKQWPRVLSEDAGDHSPDSLLYKFSLKPAMEQPRFILFTGEKNINNVILKARKQYPSLVYETTIEPGFIDKLVHWMNPVNKNRTMIIYRNTSFYPSKVQ